MSIASIAALPHRRRGGYLSKCRSVELISNLYKVNFNEEASVHIYAFQVFPEIAFDNRIKLKNIICAAKDNIQSMIGPFVLSGRTFFASGSPITTESTIAFTLGSQPFEIVCKLVRTVSFKDLHSSDKKKMAVPLNFFNNMIKNFFNQLGFIEIGKSRKYFDPKSRTNLDNAGIMIYNGFSTSFNILQDGLFLKIDPSMKIVRNESVLEVINKIYSRHTDKTKDQKRNLIKQELINKMVMGNYGKSRYYVVEDVIFDVSLETYMIKLEKGSINMLTYYKQTYGVTISNKKQPLLKATGGDKKKSFEIILIPELLLMSGLPDDFDERKRRQISGYTIVKPAQKLDQIQGFMDKVNQSLDCFTPKSISDNLGLRIETQLTKVTAKQFTTPVLQLGKDSRIDEYKVANFLLFNQPLYSTKIPLNVSIISVQGYDLKQIKDLMGSTCRNLNVNYKLKTFNLNYNDSRGVLKGIEQILFEQGENNSSNMFWFIIPPNFKSQYKMIKRATLKANIQQNSQISLTSTLAKKGFASILTKVLLQMIVKVGNKLWVPRVSTQIQNRGVMIIGIDTTKDTSLKGKMVVAYSANVNPQMSEFHSNYDYESTNNAIKIRKIVGECVAEYLKKNNAPPQDIIILKCGTTAKNQIGLILQAEIIQAKEALKIIPRNYRSSNLSFIVVDKNCSQKFFAQRQNDIVNPSYGTLVNSSVTSEFYDFYIVSQHCNMGTAKPAYYRVVYTDSDMEEGVLEELMYVQSFNYMGWTGSVRVPAVLQYAKKLAAFAGEHINGPNEGEDMRKHLYFI